MSSFARQVATGHGARNRHRSPGQGPGSMLNEGHRFRSPPPRGEGGALALAMRGLSKPGWEESPPHARRNSPHPAPLRRHRSKLCYPPPRGGGKAVVTAISVRAARYRASAPACRTHRCHPRESGDPTHNLRERPPAFAWDDTELGCRSQRLHYLFSDTSTRVPSPSFERMVSMPRWRLTICLTMARPSPVPLRLRLDSASTR